MNKNPFSGFAKAKSVLSEAKDAGVKIRFAFTHDSFGNFGLEGKVEEITPERWLFRGQGCNALVDWNTCKLEEVQEAQTEGTPFTFQWRFKLDRGNFFFVAGLEDIP